MSDLKTETLKKCFCLLREFIDEPSGKSSSKGAVILALNQLERVTAGAKENPDANCIDTPLADGAALPDGE